MQVTTSAIVNGEFEDKYGKRGRAVCLTVFCNPQRNSRKPVFGFRLLGMKRAICKVLDNNKRSSENRFSDDLFVFYFSTTV